MTRVNLESQRQSGPRTRTETLSNGVKTAQKQAHIFGHVVDKKGLIARQWRQDGLLNRMSWDSRLSTQGDDLTPHTKLSNKWLVNL